MSTEQDNFDDLLKSKLDGADFSFNEANWDKAEILIIQAEKKRKRRIIGFIFFIGMLLGICVMIPFISNEKSIEKKDVNVEDKKIVNSLKDKSENNSNVSKANSGTQTNNKNKQLTVSNDYMKHENKDEEIIVKKKEPIITTLSTKTKQSNNSANTNYNKTRVSEVIKTQKQKGRGKDDGNIGSSSTVEKNGMIDVAEVNNDKKEKVKNIISIKNNFPNNNENVSGSIEILGLINRNLRKDSILVIKDSIVIAGIDVAKPIVNTTESFKKTTLFSIDAGANYTCGWKNSSAKEATGFNAIFGVSVTHQFAKKWGILVGLQYNSLAHLNYSNYTTSNLQYDFGYNQTKTVVTPTILYYLAIPVKLQYHLNEKNSLSIGLNTLYLLNTSSRVDSYTQGTFGTTNNNVTTKHGYMDGFSTWDLQPAIAYRRRIVKCLSVSAEVYYGLIDIKNNTVFGLVKSEHNSGLKLTLSYNLLHK